MKLIKYEKIGTEVLKDLDLYKVGWRFRYRNLKSLAGYCDYRHKTITLSKHLVLNNSDEKIMNTLIHEIAHALTPKGRSHGRAWSRNFKDLLKIYEQPINTSRCYDSSYDMPEKQYKVECNTCGEVYGKHRMGRKIKRQYSQGLRYHRACRGNDFTIYKNDTLIIKTEKK